MDRSIAQPPSGRLLTLDVIRGIAVMGIFSVNVVGMAMIEAAYFYPPAYGFESLGDKVMHAANFLLVDGKMRSLFSILFGASLLLVIEGAIAAGRSPATAHYARMASLLAFGLIHFYLIWWGDILAEYALVGMVAFLFCKLDARQLLIGAVGLLLLHSVPAVIQATVAIAGEVAADARRPHPDAATTEYRQREERFFPSRAELARDAAAHETPFARLRYATSADPLRPFSSALGLLPETLGLMLLGMAGYRSGFLTGAWNNRRYRQAAVWGIGPGLLVTAGSLFLVVDSGYAGRYLYAARNAWTAPLRPVMALGYAALIILLFRRPGALRDRVAAVGRAAFTNYLGCSLIGVAIFYDFGGGLYGRLSRGEAWLLVPPVWALMLLWSKAWLDRFAYGPFEWAWRSLARWKLQPMRKRIAVTSVAAEA
jgi:uncharacterized protein